MYVLEFPKWSNKKLTTPQATAELLSDYSKKPEEHLLLVLVNSSMEVIEVKDFATGSENMCRVKMTDLTRYLLKSNYAGFILSHNHPNGSMYPSDHDDQVTRTVVVASYCVGVQCLDHVILVPDGDYFSYQEASSPYFERGYSDSVLKGGE